MSIILQFQNNEYTSTPAAAELLTSIPAVGPRVTASA